MAMPRSKGKKYVVDANSYSVAVTVREIDKSGAVKMGVTIRADYGVRSFCMVKGLVNRSYWHDYPEIEEMRKRCLSITPGAVCQLIRLAHQSGWNPCAVKSTFELLLDNGTFKGLMAINP